jgi:hypothetical protein
MWWCGLGMGGRATGRTNVCFHGETSTADGAGAFGGWCRSRCSSDRHLCGGGTDAQQFFQQLACVVERERGEGAFFAAHVEQMQVVWRANKQNGLMGLDVRVVLTGEAQSDLGEMMPEGSGEGESAGVSW